MRYTGPLGKSFAGDKPRAMSLQSRARVLVGRLLYALKRQGGKGQQYGTERQADGSVIHAYVLANIKGQEPLIRTWIESPTYFTSGTSQRYTSWFKAGIAFTPVNILGVYADELTDRGLHFMVYGPPFSDENDIGTGRYRFRSLSMVGEDFTWPGDYVDVSWFAELDEEKRRVSIKKEQPPNFGCMNWVGTDDFDVLSWHGPASRHLPFNFTRVMFFAERWKTKLFHKMAVIFDTQESAFRNITLESGRAIKDSVVIGAAIDKESGRVRLALYDGSLWIVSFTVTVVEDVFSFRYNVNPSSFRLETKVDIGIDICSGFYFDKTGRRGVITYKENYEPGADSQYFYSWKYTQAFTITNKNGSTYVYFENSYIYMREADINTSESRETHECNSQSLSYLMGTTSDVSWSIGGTAVIGADFSSSGINYLYYTLPVCKYSETTTFDPPTGTYCTQTGTLTGEFFVTGEKYYTSNGFSLTGSTILVTNSGNVLLPDYSFDGDAVATAHERATFLAADLRHDVFISFKISMSGANIACAGASVNIEQVKNDPSYAGNFFSTFPPWGPYSEHTYQPSLLAHKDFICASVQLYRNTEESGSHANGPEFKLERIAFIGNPDKVLFGVDSPNYFFADITVV